MASQFYYSSTANCEHCSLAMGASADSPEDLLIQMVYCCSASTLPFLPLKLNDISLPLLLVKYCRQPGVGLKGKDYCHW